MPNRIISELEHELANFLRRYDRVRVRSSKDSLHNLERAAYVVLGGISEAGAVRSATLALSLGLDKTTVSRHIEKLEDNGFIERLADPTDGRASLLRLSAKGRRQLDNHRRYRQSILEEHLDDWSVADKRDFLRLLRKYNSAMEQRYGVDTKHEVNK